MADWSQTGNIRGPVGPQGVPGPGQVFKGQVPNYASLPTNAAPGDSYVTTDTGHLWIWNGAAWIDGGSVVGPPGPPGPQGPEGDEMFVGPNDPGTANYDFWYDTDASGSGGGGGGVTPPPSDGGEYVFRNGIWRLKSQSFVLDGLTTLVVPVPVGARMVKIMGSVFPLVGNGVTAQVSVDGTTFITSTYYWGGASFNTGTDATLLYPEGSSSAMFVTPTSNLTNFPHTFTAEMNLVRATTAKSFSLKSHGICHSDLPNRLLRTGLFNNWLDPAATTALSLKAFQLVSGSTFGVGSYAEISWGY